MEKEFVPYNLSLKLKTLGFDEPCFGYYTHKNELKPIKQLKDEFNSLKNSEVNTTYCSSVTPTFSQAFRWFRDNYNKLSPIDHSTGGWYFVIREIGGSTDPMLKAVCGSGFKSYEEAELACLEKLIEIVEYKSE